MKPIFFFLLLCCTLCLHAQRIPEKLTAAFRQFELDPQMQNGIASLYVVNQKTGQVLFDRHSSVGLAPASTQKLITAASAYELLGSDFYYETHFAMVRAGNNAQLLIRPSGDPTLGSWRWKSTTEQEVLKRVLTAVRKNKFDSTLRMVIDAKSWNYETVPDGWIWQDIGNYYGAGADALNWRENQFDLLLMSGKNIGDLVSVVATEPSIYGFSISSQVVSAAKGTGDNAYIYFPLASNQAVVRGTIPVAENRFRISGAFPSGRNQLLSLLTDSLGLKPAGNHSFTDTVKGQGQVIHREISPSLDSIIYWFNRRSINLYGEALVKTIGQKHSGKGSTEEGLKQLKKFWKEKGIAETELNVVDGSGLSPLNRVTTRAQARILVHALRQPWYPAFYASLPEFNGMKMKSGTIRDVKAFTGYHTSKDGNSYIFSFIVNNYNGSASSLVQKMYKVLDVLK